MQSQHNKTPWKRFAELLRFEKKDISSLYFYAFIAGILSLSLPLGIQSVIHFIQSGSITTSWVVLVALVIVGVVLTGVMQIMQLRITENIQQRLYIHYSFQFAHRFPRFDRLSLKGLIPVELMNRFFDIISLQKGFSKVLLDFTSAFLQILFSLIVLSLYHPFYILFSLSLIVLLVLVFRPIMRKGLETSLIESKYKYKTAFWLQEIAKADWSFRLIPDEQLSLNKLDESTSSYLSSRESHFKILWKQYIWMIAIKSIIVASLLGLGGYLVISQQINLGQFVAAEVLILLLIGAVEKIIQSLETFYDVCTSLEKLEQIKDLPLTFEECETSKPSDIFPLEVLNINKKENQAIVQINQKQHIQFIGTEQNEVNTFLRCFIDPSISNTYKPRWNFKLPNAQSLTSDYERIGWYAKGSHLIEGTLLENIQMGRTNVTEHQVIYALETLQLTHLFKENAEGLLLPITKSNRILSENERERILIARAIVHEPELLILSMVGTSLNDSEKIELLQQLTLTLPTTTFIVANETPLNDNWTIIDFKTLVA